jgi:hypothetical protein
MWLTTNDERLPLSKSVWDAVAFEVFSPLREEVMSSWCAPHVWHAVAVMDHQIQRQILGLNWWDAKKWDWLHEDDVTG